MGIFTRALYPHARRVAGVTLLFERPNPRQQGVLVRLVRHPFLGWRIKFLTQKACFLETKNSTDVSVEFLWCTLRDEVLTAVWDDIERLAGIRTVLDLIVERKASA